MLWFHTAFVLPHPPAEEKCAGPFPNVANGTGQYSILRRGHQLVIPALSFTGCGQTLRWHVRGRGISWWSGIRRRHNSFRFTLKLWRPTPSGSYTEVRPGKSLTSSVVHLSSQSARVDYQVAFSSGDIPGLSASNLLSLEYTSIPSHGTSVYYWLITTPTLPTTWNPRSHASTVTSQLPLLSIEGAYTI